MKGYSVDAGRVGGAKTEATTDSPPWPGAVSTATRIMPTGLGGFLLLAIAGGVTFGQAPLYSSNQNQYFLHGLARAGFGFLRQDWLANTADPTPVFSALVELTARYLHEGAFFIYFLLLAGVYFSGLIGVTVHAVPIDRSRTRFLAYLIVVLGMHSALLATLSLATLGVDLRALLTNGVAGQFIMGDILQPSMAGVFLIASIYAFVRDRRMAASIYAAAAAVLHPTYLLGAGVLIASYAVVIARETRSVRQAAGLVAVGALLMLPVAVSVIVVFRPTTPAAWAAAQDVLMNVRLQHHALVQRWLGAPAYAQLVLVCAGLWVVRRSPRLFAVLLTSALVAVALTIVQVFSHSASLALVFPWRLSVYVVPLSASVLTASLVSWVHDRYGETPQRARLVAWGSAVIAVVLLLGGWQYTQRLADDDRQDAASPAMDFVRRAKASGEVYLIPPALERFRLYTGAPIFVDRKSIPYKDLELAEWYARSETAWGLSRLSDPALVCQAVTNVAGRYAVTHTLLRRAQVDGSCARLQPVYEDAEYGVYRVVAR